MADAGPCANCAKTVITRFRCNCEDHLHLLCGGCHSYAQPCPVAGPLPPSRPTITEDEFDDLMVARPVEEPEWPGPHDAEASV